MIAGIGIDIIDVSRVKRAMENNSSFKDKVFSNQEIEYCESKAEPFMSFAVRFAAKEAFMKALGTGWNSEVSWSEIETVIEKDNPPQLKISGQTLLALNKRNITSCFLSLSHEKVFSIACVILERS